MVERLLSARPPVVPQQGAQRKESFSLKLVWMWDHIRHMPPTDDPDTLRQYARYYILLLIVGYLMTDKSNNFVHLHWLPLLQETGMLTDRFVCINGRMTLQMRLLSSCRLSWDMVGARQLCAPPTLWTSLMK
ncbi:hypothetical protein Ahy_B09g096591 isoform B [Arachis hypogaea]|uniref:Aminotransferase-like plant mobile domain-containing protein n=1 Tax=Arachis hypogaea TaxID=3818 RepID=A0A444XLI1_ARAHY|nr:hypothetical protein Ahy_B09g096591 isoform B [Arachis hypogaea]